MGGGFVHAKKIPGYKVLHEVPSVGEIILEKRLLWAVQLILQFLFLRLVLFAVQWNYVFSAYKRFVR